jgi:hypothetical protein
VIQDTHNMMAKHHGCFLLQDKAALVALLPNKVGEAA